MAARIRRDQILGALAQRYDFHSAHNILEEALATAGLPPADSYSPEETSRLVWGLNSLGERAQKAVMALLELAGEAATADLPDEQEGEQILSCISSDATNVGGDEEDVLRVREDEVPLVVAQVVQAALSTRTSRIKAQQEQAAARQQPEPAGSRPGEEGRTGEERSGPAEADEERADEAVVARKPHAKGKGPLDWN